MLQDHGQAYVDEAQVYIWNDVTSIIPQMYAWRNFVSTTVFGRASVATSRSS
jgi:hypothetical protein